MWASCHFARTASSYLCLPTSAYLGTYLPACLPVHCRSVFPSSKVEVVVLVHGVGGSLVGSIISPKRKRGLKLLILWLCHTVLSQSGWQSWSFSTARALAQLLEDPALDGLTYGNYLSRYLPGNGS